MVKCVFNVFYAFIFSLIRNILLVEFWCQVHIGDQRIAIFVCRFQRKLEDNEEGLTHIRSDLFRKRNFMFANEMFKGVEILSILLSQVTSLLRSTKDGG